MNGHFLRWKAANLRTLQEDLEALNVKYAEVDRFDSTLNALLGEDDKSNKKDIVSLTDNYVEVAKACKVYNEEIDDLVKQFLRSDDKEREDIGEKLISKVIEALLK
jgi:septal ring factor EnvC (AmiA/AmiB activator)